MSKDKGNITTCYCTSEITVSNRKEDPVMSAERMSDFRQRKISSIRRAIQIMGGGWVGVGERYTYSQ